MTKTSRLAYILNALVFVLIVAAFARGNADRDDNIQMPITNPVSMSVSAQHDEHERFTVPLCEYEDGSGPNDNVCFWNADVSGLGNGGESFMVTHPKPGMTVYAYLNGTTEVFQD